MEAAEPAAAGAAPAPGDGREGVAGARRGPSPRQHRRLLSTVQRSNPDPKPSAPAAPAAGALHRLHGRLPLHGRSPLPERHLRPRMPPLTRREATVPGSFLLRGPPLLRGSNEAHRILQILEFATELFAAVVVGRIDDLRMIVQEKNSVSFWE